MAIPSQASQINLSFFMVVQVKPIIMEILTKVQVVSLKVLITGIQSYKRPSKEFQQLHSTILLLFLGYMVQELPISLNQDLVVLGVLFRI